MNNPFFVLPSQGGLEKIRQELAACNAMSEPYGLVLSQNQMQRLMERRFQALAHTGRVEFGEGILKKLVQAFRDSPYLEQWNYEETLAELQDMFYHFKGEAMERLSDDELIEAMQALFDGRGQGSLEYLAGTALENLCRPLRGGSIEEQWDEEADEEDYEE